MFSAAISWFGSIFPTPIAQSQPRFPPAARVWDVQRSAGQKLTHFPPWCASTSCSSCREGLLLQRMTETAPGNPSFGNNRPTTEPSSYFFHPNVRIAELQPVAGIPNPLSVLPFLNTVVTMATLFYFEKTLACPTILTKARLLFGFGCWGKPGKGQMGEMLVGGWHIWLWCCGCSLQCSGDTSGALGSVPALVARL